MRNETKKQKKIITTPRPNQMVHCIFKNIFFRRYHFAIVSSVFVGSIFECGGGGGGDDDDNNIMRLYISFSVSL